MPSHTAGEQGGGRTGELFVVIAELISVRSESLYCLKGLKEVV